ncbi:MAG: cell division protein ZapA [Bacteroidales bacterium]|jgi:hypothetical protein|nr:cell division protein ZapA [Bacteroidales bacterium]
MAEGKKLVVFHVAGQPIKVTIKASEEDLYRKAEARLQGYIQRLAEDNHITDMLEQLRYAAFNSAVNEVYFIEKQEFVDTELKYKLGKVQQIVNEILEDKEQ